MPFHLITVILVKISLQKLSDAFSKYKRGLLAQLLQVQRFMTACWVPEVRPTLSGPLRYTGTSAYFHGLVPDKLLLLN
jgi:hypothetical protein